MAGVPYPYRLVIPPAPPLFSTRPVMGDALGGLVEALNYFPGLRGRGFHTYNAGRLAWDAGYRADLGFPASSDTVSEKHRLILRTSPVSRHLALSIWIACDTERGSGDQTVTASLLTMTAGSVDPGVVWSRDVGQIAGDEYGPATIQHIDPGPIIITNTYKRLAVRQLQTGGTARDGMVTGGIPTAPRLLSLEGKAGDDLELLVEGENVYVLGFTAFEWPETILEDT